MMGEGGYLLTSWKQHHHLLLGSPDLVRSAQACDSADKKFSDGEHGPDSRFVLTRRGFSPSPVSAERDRSVLTVVAGIVVVVTAGKRRARRPQTRSN